MTLLELVAARKEIDVFQGWSEPESDSGAMWFNAPLSVGGVTEQNFILAGLALKNAVDCNVCFEIRIGLTKKRKIALARYEWRSLRNGHTNPRRSGHALSGKRVGATHYHRFEDNWIEKDKRMRAGNLPFADDVEEEPQSFEELRVNVGNLLRINNIEVVEPPKWEYDLLQNGQ